MNIGTRHNAERSLKKFAFFERTNNMKTLMFVVTLPNSTHNCCEMLLNDVDRFLVLHMPDFQLLDCLTKFPGIKNASFN